MLGFDMSQLESRGREFFICDEGKVVLPVLGVSKGKFLPGLCKSFPNNSF